MNKKIKVVQEFKFLNNFYGFYFFIIFISVLFTVSCKTAEFGFNTIDINGMIYDFSNRPIPFYNVSLGKKYQSSTDINGRFIIPKVPVGEYVLTGNKKGYEILTDEIKIYENNQIIYIRIPSQKQLLEMADEELTQNNFTSAENILERAFQIDQNSIETLFYLAVVKYRQNDYENALDFLKIARKLDSRDFYIEKFINKLKETQNEI